MFIGCNLFGDSMHTFKILKKTLYYQTIYVLQRGYSCFEDVFVGGH